MKYKCVYVIIKRYKSQKLVLAEANWVSLDLY